MRSKLPFVLSVGLLAAATLPAHAGTMPQFDFGNPLLRAQVEWGAVIFVVMYAAFALVGLPRVAGILTARDQTISENLDRARRSKADADRAVAELNEARRRALAEAQGAVADAAQKAKEAAEAKAAEASARLEAQLVESEARIEAMRAGAQAALHDAAMETADDLISRLIGRPATPGVTRDAVGAALAARGRA